VRSSWKLIERPEEIKKVIVSVRSRVKPGHKKEPY
jgi:hypothetical protein